MINCVYSNKKKHRKYEKNNNLKSCENLFECDDNKNGHIIAKIVNFLEKIAATTFVYLKKILGTQLRTI